MRAHFLRGFAPGSRKATVTARDTNPASEGCATCRDSQIHCETPTACQIAEPNEPGIALRFWAWTRRHAPAFWDSPVASVAIAVALLIAVGVVAWRVTGGR